MKRKTSNKVVNVGVAENIHREWRDFADARGMKIRFLPRLLWEGFKELTPEQRERAQERLHQREPVVTA